MKKQKADQSGFCRHSGHHHLCSAQWETPTVIVTCDCACHARLDEDKVAKVKRKVVPKTLPSRKIVAKS